MDDDFKINIDQLNSRWASIVAGLVTENVVLAQTVGELRESLVELGRQTEVVPEPES